MSVSASPFHLELRRRLRRQPSPVSVPGSLPVLFFGDALHARLLTVGLNPSDQEYVDAKGIELDGMYRARGHVKVPIRGRSKSPPSTV
jgi:hypothetical protein